MDIAQNKAAWLEARRALLAREKAHVTARDELAAQRRALPALRIDTDYVFQGAYGPQRLRELFDERSQLLVYHFMYGADWEAGCTSCSFWADNLNGIEAHLAARDISLVLASAAPYEVLARYRERMGWNLTWVSHAGSAFGRDMGVSFTADEVESGAQLYNFGTNGFGSTEASGLSCFERVEDAIYLRYATFARGLDHFNGAYQLLDLAPKGRNEEGLAFSMAWLRRHDEYGSP